MAPIPASVTDGATTTRRDMPSAQGRGPVMLTNHRRVLASHQPALGTTSNLVTLSCISHADQPGNLGLTNQAFTPQWPNGTREPLTFEPLPPPVARRGTP